MLRAQPRYTLFPYTSLFRSIEAEMRAHEQRDAGVALRQLVVREAHGALPRLGQQQLGACAAVVGLFPAEQHAGVVVVQDQDRKSTRLNSSHVSISYAVFFLK